MTKKDYQLIAKAIYGATLIDGPELLQRAILLEVLVHEFERDNPRFNRDKFLAACCQPPKDK